jgi:hypothetical protein
MSVGDFILAKGQTRHNVTIAPNESHMYVFNTLFNTCFFLVFIPVPMSISLLHEQSCSCPVPIPCRRQILFCAADPTLQVTLSFLHSTFSGSSRRCMSLHSALVHWTVNKRLNELLVSPMVENKVVDWLQKSLVFRRRKNDHDIPPHLSKYMRPPWSSRTLWQVHNYLILELTVKVIISVIVKYVEGKIQFRCSHMSHEVSQVLAIRLAAQH